jgi:hypothetical protein
MLTLLSNEYSNQHLQESLRKSEVIDGMEVHVMLFITAIDLNDSLNKCMLFSACDIIC